ncbi:MAG: DUF1016 N-terminal domain-containing protein [Myxococcota bacterium]
MPRLATDLRNELPEVKGFSERNLNLTVQFFQNYANVFGSPARQELEFKNESSTGPISQRSVAQLPEGRLEGPHGMSLPTLQQALLSMSWAHNVVLMQKIKDIPTRVWYARQVLDQGWSRDTLIVQIKNRAHERQGAAVSNFGATLPLAHASLAQGLLRDPYLFDFLTLEEPFHERELETGLLSHIQ